VKTIHVTASWRSHHELEVPDDFQDTGDLNDFPTEALDEITADAAELVDWTVRVA
jgi:hypothetical protein